MLNEDVEWLEDLAEALTRAIRFDSISLGESEDMHVIQISNQLGLEIAARLRGVARRIKDFSNFEKTSPMPGSLLAHSDCTSGPGHSNLPLTDPSSSPSGSSPKGFLGRGQGVKEN